MRITRDNQQFFDSQADYAVVQRCLPHWSQAGTITFITWRTWDSMPEKVIQTCQAEQAVWLRQHNIDPADEKWQTQLEQLDPQQLAEFHSLLSERWHHHLDKCHGSCVLRQPELAKIVADSLLHFNGDRYLLTDFVIMPNHVHVLAAFPTEEALLAQCNSWKHFTATQINRALGRSGRFWQQESFDHLVRSPEHFEHLRRYVANNPQRACLKCGEYLHYASST